MTNPIIATTHHPKPTFSTITQLGLKAYNLAIADEPLIAPRLPQGAIPALASNLTALGVVVPGVKQARAEAQTSTAAEEAAVLRGYERVQALRTAVKKAKARKEIAKAYGVGVTVHANVASSVKAVMKQILDRAKDKPEEALGLGIVQKDLDGMAQAHAAIVAAEKAHDDKRASAPLTTQERNLKANLVVATVARISGAGLLEFVDDPVKHAAYGDLVPPPRKPSKSPKKSAAKTTSAKKEAAKKEDAAPAPASANGASNGTSANGASNGASANGASNGASANGASNGASANGASNGASANGAVANGTSANGAVANGTSATGAVANPQTPPVDPPK